MLKFDCLETATDTAYHEAGHVVAGMGVGCVPLEVCIRADGTGRVEWLHGTAGQSIALARRTLIHVVAGPLAEFLHEADDLWCTRSRWADRLDPGDWESSYRLLSARIRRGETGDGQGCDTTLALLYGREVCRRLRLQDEGQWDERRVHGDWTQRDGRPTLFWHRGYTVGAPPEFGTSEEPDEEPVSIRIEHTGPITPPEVTHDEIVAEVARAERWAERLLNRRWSATVAVAEALLKHPEGRLSGKEAMALVAANRV